MLFGEVAIWKMPLSTAAATAYCNAVVPLSKLGAYDLNRNLLFFLDFAEGSFSGKCNRYSGFTRPTAVSRTWYIDSDKQTVTNIGDLTSTFSITSDLPNCTGEFGFRFPSVSRYNRFVCGVGTAGAHTIYLSYLPRKRR